MDQLLAAIMSLPPEERQKIPAGMPPPGVTPNLIDPPSQAYAYHVIGALLIAFMMVFVTIRYYMKFKVWKQLALDDWTTLGALLSFFAFYISYTYCLVLFGFGRHAWDVSIAALLDQRFHIAVELTLWLPIVSNALVKCSLLIMYLRFFKPFVWVRWLVYFGLFANIATNLIFTVLMIYYTVPHVGQAWIDVFTGPLWYKTLDINVPIVAFGLGMDLYIFMIPSVAVWKLRISKKKRIGVLLVFGIGLTACIASSLGVYYRLQLNEYINTDRTYHTPRVWITTMAEICLGIACNCMPSCAPFVKNNKETWSSLASRLLRPLSSFRSRASTSEASTTSSLFKAPINPFRRSDKNFASSDSIKRLNSSELTNKQMHTYVLADRTPVDLENGRIHVESTITQDYNRNNSGRI